MRAQPRPASQCWVLIDRDAVPAELDDRVTSLALLSLLPQEVERLLECTVLSVEFSDEERALARALIIGSPLPVVARELGISPRSVHRRIARLRERMGAPSTESLVATLVRMGF